uniref:Alpha-1,3-mannosyl-glycoprotein 2-beta-N-acetylglucosaminyltransferase n=2 Tax=Parascaris univalens TaxID=6257 RepID=A0A915B6B5_PARUN
VLQTANRHLIFILLLLCLLILLKERIYCPWRARCIAISIRQTIHKVYQIEHPRSRPINVAKNHMRKQKRIAVIVISCYRTALLRRVLNDISRLLPKSGKFGAFVSLGCDNSDTRQITEQFTNIVLIQPQRLDSSREINSTGYGEELSAAFLARITTEHRKSLLEHGKRDELIRISAQYKYALNVVFDVFAYDYAILIEENSLISDDFFEYFLAGERLLSQDSSIFCITAWNDNGIPSLIERNNSLLWRNDFFSGVGWMISSLTWSDLSYQWAELFWDEWLRMKMHDQGKVCIRPEISRIAIADDSSSREARRETEPYGFKAVTLNVEPFNFTAANLDYLIREHYDVELEKTIGEAIIVEESDILNGLMNNNRSHIKIYYSTTQRFERLSNFFKYVPYSQGDLCVTCYKGILRLHWHSSSVYIIKAKRFQSS